MGDFPDWFNLNEYQEFINSNILFEVNIPLQKEKMESRKKIREFDRQTSIRRANLRRETMRDESQAKAKGIRMGLGEEFRETLTFNFLSKLLEARTPIKAEKSKMRPEIDPADRERNRKRESRRQDAQANLKNIIIVKNKSLDRIEIITRSDFDPKVHELIKGKTSKFDKGMVSIEDLKKYSQRSDFRNTKTSVKILGKIQKAEEDNRADEEKSQIEKGNPAPVSAAPPPPPPRPRVPDDGKEITDELSTYPDWDHDLTKFAGGMVEILNTLSGTEMSGEMQQALSDSRTLGDSLNRFLNEFTTEFPQAGNYKYEPLVKPLKTGKFWSNNKITKSSGTAAILASNDKEKIGMNLKVGQQLKPTEPGDMPIIFNTILEAVNPAEMEIFPLLLKDLVAELKTNFTGVNTFRMQSPRKNEGANEIDKRISDANSVEVKQKMFLNKANEILEKFINRNKTIKTSILAEALTGNLKFDGKEGSAQMLISTNKDGTNTRVIPLDNTFFNSLASSSSTDLKLKFNPNRNIPEDSPVVGMLQSLTQLNEGALDAITSLEGMINQFANPMLFMQAFGIQIMDAVFESPISYSDYHLGDSDTFNTVIFNPGSSAEETFNIPVRSDFSNSGKKQNYIEKGLDEILESYLLINDFLVEQIKTKELDLIDGLVILDENFNLTEKRNYRKEYDNYHSKPKQRANRSKRVLARRKMEEKGRVKKGDGKDVDHKDGNPQNNSDSNLRILSKSKNRSMNEDHGAGFDGTDLLLQNLVNSTPFAVNPKQPSKEVKYTEDVYVKKQKKK